MNKLVIILFSAVLLIACGGQNTDNTQEQLTQFYEINGGRDAHPDVLVKSVEAMIFIEDDINSGDFNSAQNKLNQIFSDQPLSTNIWHQYNGWSGLNIGTPVGYYGLRMLEEIIETGNVPTKGHLQLTAVVATCATVQRPTLPNLEPETVLLNIHPDILKDNAAVLHQSTALFRKWVKAITGGYELNLVVAEMQECASVTYSDDGAIIVSYPNYSEMVDSVKNTVPGVTDMWWVVAPSGVPGDGAGYNRHFITGGMGIYGNGRPLFISDDAWFIRKPEHLGSGAYTDVERRVYQPQWFQHEFMHHLYRSWPEFGLEETGHQWFDRATWPLDFVGQFEPDYYSESINKRIATASPSIIEVLKAPEKITNIEIPMIVGEYRREPVENAYHIVTVTANGANQALWTNAAGVQWTLTLKDGLLKTEESSPYGENIVDVTVDIEGKVSLWFLGEAYVSQHTNRSFNFEPAYLRRIRSAQDTTPLHVCTHAELH